MVETVAIELLKPVFTSRGLVPMHILLSITLSYLSLAIFIFGSVLLIYSNTH
jgi:hypothetical protein